MVSHVQILIGIPRLLLGLRKNSSSWAYSVRSRLHCQNPILDDPVLEPLALSLVAVDLSPRIVELRLHGCRRD